MVALGTASEDPRSVFAHLPVPVDQAGTSVPVTGTETDGYSPVFKNSYVGEGPLIDRVHPDLATVYDYFEYSVETKPLAPCIGRRLHQDGALMDHFTFSNYRDVQQMRNRFGSGLLSVLDEVPGVDSADFILGLYSPNRYEWMVADLASHAYSITNVALYDTLGPESSRYILDLTGAPVILLAKDKIRSILDLKRTAADLAHLKVLVSMDDIDSTDDADLVASVAKAGLKLFDFTQIVRLGAKFPRPVKPPRPDDVYTISFTSGTTSVPKGCCLTHANAVAGITFCWVHIDPPEHPVSLAFLPLAHVLERFKVLYEISRGAAVAMPHDPARVLTFLDDIKVLEPTHMCAVPRLYNRIEAGIRERINSSGWFSRTLAQAAIRYKVYAVKNHCDDNWISRIANAVVINRIKQAIGFKNLSFLISGSAPLSEQTIVFLKAVLDCGFYQGYGATESFAAIAVTVPKDAHPNSCGPIGVSLEFRLKDLPEMGYSYKENNSGELLLRGPQLFQGYFARPDLTAEAKDADGWFATGDVVRLTNPGNKLVVIDRAKNFFKLAQGEYVAAEKIENIYLSNVSFISLLFLYGDSFQSYLVAVLNVDPAIFVKFLRKFPAYEHVHTIEDVDLSSRELRKFVLTEINKLVSQSGLFGFEKFKNLKIGIDLFKLEDDVITPTLKVKRPQAKKHFLEDIDRMYAEGPI